MKKILLLCAVLLAGLPVYAQKSSEEYQARYSLLVSKVGPDGLGLETLIGNWEKEHPDDVKMLCAKSDFYFAKSHRTEIVRKDQEKFMGAKPVVTLKDSLGNPVNYFQEEMYDDSLYAISSKAIDKAVRLEPDDIELWFHKISSQVGYEKESPDMAESTLKALIDYIGTNPSGMKAKGIPLDEETFLAAVQDYCFAFFKIGSPRAMEAFKSVSDAVLRYYPSSTLFLCNQGTYHLIARKDYKQAKKYYDKVLKIDKSDYTAIRNCVLMSRSQKDVKMEKKYLEMLVRYTPDEGEKESARARLVALEKKK